MGKKTTVPRASRAVVDPYVSLAVGIVKQAVVDLANDDPAKHWDALLWFCDPGAADLFYFAGLEVYSPLRWLRTGQVERWKQVSLEETKNV